ncbi:Methyltransferase type 11 [Dillenia turbinata]|uniref:Methyltransferase type 11 n=1 Tax=Dillenia turbinata TaxID=194707 RepID=A0AAN8UV37_9MAGN
MENLRREAPPLATDLAAVCRRSLSQTATEPEMSDLTMEGSKHAVNRNRNQNEIGVKDTIGISKKASPPLVTSGQAEKLKFKNSFDFVFSGNGVLDQLKSQMNFAEEITRTLKPKGFLVIHTFVVLHDGCRQKINFEQNKPPTKVAVYSNVMRQSSSHCSSVGKHQITSSSDSQQCSVFKSKKAHLQGSTSFSCGLASSSQLQMGYLCHEDPVGTIQEGSDQNFVDEDPAETSTNLPREKRLKMVSTDPSNKDQVVPSEAFFQAEGLTTSKASSKRVGLPSHDLKPENPERFDSWKSALEPFLRES